MLQPVETICNNLATTPNQWVESSSLSPGAIAILAPARDFGIQRNHLGRWGHGGTF